MSHINGAHAQPSVSGLVEPSLTEKLFERAGIMSTNKDNSWDYLNKFSNRVRTSLITTTTQVEQGRQFLETHGCLTPEAIILINGINQSVESAAKAWRETSEKHMGRSGFGANAQEHNLITNTGLEYIQIFEVMTQQNMYTLPRLQEMIIECEQAIKFSEAAEAAEISPTGV